MPVLATAATTPELLPRRATPAGLDRAGAPSLRLRGPAGTSLPTPWEAPMPATLVCARLTDTELTLRSRPAPMPAQPCPTRPPPPGPWPSARSRRAPIGQPTGPHLQPEPVGCGRRPCPADRGPPVSRSSVLRVQVQEYTAGLVDAVAVVRGGQRAVFILLRLEAVPGHWELAVTAIAPAGISRSCGCPPARVGGGRGPRPGLGAQGSIVRMLADAVGMLHEVWAVRQARTRGAYSAMGVTPHPPWDSYRPLSGLPEVLPVTTPR
jgi:hypothetical protein